MSGLQGNITNRNGRIESLYFVRAPLGDVDGKSIRDRFAHRGGHAYAAGLGQLLHTLRQDHTGAGDRIVCDYHLAQRNTDPQHRSDAVREGGVTLGVVLLRRQSGQDRVGGAVEFRHQGIAAHFVNHAAVALNIPGSAQKRGVNALMGERLVLTHKSGRSHHVGVQNDGKLGLGCHDSCPMVSVCCRGHRGAV